jgi:hypothetical protein
MLLWQGDIYIAFCLLPLSSHGELLSESVMTLWVVGSLHNGAHVSSDSGPILFAILNFGQGSNVATCLYFPSVQRVLISA